MNLKGVILAVLLASLLVFVGCESDATANTQLSELERLGQGQLRMLRNSVIVFYRAVDLPSVIAEERVAAIKKYLESETGAVKDDMLRIKVAIKGSKEKALKKNEPYKPVSIQLTPLKTPPRGVGRWKESQQIRNWKSLDHQALIEVLPSNWRELLLEELSK